MFARLSCLVLAAFLALSGAAFAQEPTPTPTPTPEPREERSDEVRDIYRDYRRDGAIEGCDHERGDLRDALDGLDAQADLETPDLRPLLEAAIESHRDGTCEELAEQEEQEQQQEDDTTDDGFVTPPPTVPSTPSTPSTPPSTDFGGSLDPLPGGGGGGGSGDSGPPTADDVSPLDPEITPVPPATEAPPASTTIPPSEAAGPAATPSAVFRNADDGVPLPVLLLGGLVALVALLALLLALLGRLGWGERAPAGPRRAWREAAFRAGGTWSDFADWIRVGR